jgi:hypothetical protein
MYVLTSKAFGQPQMLDGSLAGMLGEDVDSKKPLEDFLNQVRRQPENFKKLLLTVALHPDPKVSVTWGKQTFPFGKQTKYLVDEVLMSEQPKEVLAKLKQISDTNFKQQINDELDLQTRMIIATTNLHKVVLQPFLFDPLLLPAVGGSLPYTELSKLARHFAQHMLSKDLAQQIMNSDASEAHLAYLGGFLRSHAAALQKKDPHFKKQVSIARQWREREQRRKQQGTKKNP